VRQNTERLRKAAETIAQLETELAAKPEAPAPVVVARRAGGRDDTLQRTLLLARSSSMRRSRCRGRAERVIADAEAQARKVQAESEQRLREEIARLESNRGSSRTRSIPWPVSSRRSASAALALSEMLSWWTGACRRVRRRRGGDQHLRRTALVGATRVRSPAAPVRLAAALNRLPARRSGASLTSPDRRRRAHWGVPAAVGTPTGGPGRPHPSGARPATTRVQGHSTGN